MTESFLHYIWQFQYFSRENLVTTDGEPVNVIHTGFLNSNAGPDFFNAKVRIGEIEWIGNVEIHIDASGWRAHHHDTDLSYDNVVLHVVWNEDEKIMRQDQTRIPTLELRNRISENLLLQYRRLVNNPEQIPCSSSFANVSMLTKFSMLDKTLVQRLEHRASSIHAKLERNHGDWEQTTYELLCRNFGFKVNAEPFEQLARTLPYKILLKHADQLVQVEALLFGQAGFLEEPGPDGYLQLLRREHNFLSNKYGMVGNRLNKSQWKFMRLRPANFPTIRLSQLAALLAGQKNVFSRVIDSRDFATLQKLFSVVQSSYWQTHYHFMKRVEDEIPGMGHTSVENIIINTVAPVMVAYGKARDEQELVDRAIQILQHISSEDNVITKQWTALGLKSKCAADSQALIELYNNFCARRRCLDCSIGFDILQSPKT